MKKFLEFIDGHKSKLVGLAVFVVAGLAGVGVIGEEQAKPILGMLTGVGVYTFRDAMRKLEK